MNTDLDTFAPLLESITREGHLVWSTVSPRHLLEAKIASAGEMSRMASFLGGTLYLIDHGMVEDRVVLAYRRGMDTGTVVDGPRASLGNLLGLAGFQTEPLLKLDSWLRQSLPS